MYFISTEIIVFGGLFGSIQVYFDKIIGIKNEYIQYIEVEE